MNANSTVRKTRGSPVNNPTGFRAHLCTTQTRTSQTVPHTPYPRKEHESIETTQVYLHADITMKENAVTRTTPTGTPPGRYKPPDDDLMTFLQNL